MFSCYFVILLLCYVWLIEFVFFVAVFSTRRDGMSFHVGIDLARDGLSNESFGAVQTAECTSWVTCLCFVLPVSAALMLEDRPRVRSGPLLSGTLQPSLTQRWYRLECVKTGHCLFTVFAVVCTSWATRKVERTEALRFLLLLFLLLLMCFVLRTELPAPPRFVSRSSSSSSGSSSSSSSSSNTTPLSLPPPWPPPGPRPPPWAPPRGAGVVYVHVYIYIYIHIYRERGERERERLCYLCLRGLCVLFGLSVA